MLIFVLHSVTLHWSALFEFPKQIVLRKERREPDQKPMIDIPDELAHCAKCTPGHQQCVQQLCNAHHTIVCTVYNEHLAKSNTLQSAQLLSTQIVNAVLVDGKMV